MCDTELCELTCYGKRHNPAGDDSERTTYDNMILSGGEQKLLISHAQIWL